jgi:hypothetical protein
VLQLDDLGMHVSPHALPVVQTLQQLPFSVSEHPNSAKTIIKTYNPFIKKC